MKKGLYGTLEHTGKCPKYVLPYGTNRSILVKEKLIEIIDKIFFNKKG